jgi:serine/threonine protein phosphatase PrpC
MRVVATAEAIPRGKDITPKDATLRIKGRHRASYLGLFDGHGEYGVEIANLAAKTVEEATLNLPNQHDTLSSAQIIRSSLRSLHNSLGSSLPDEESSTGALVSIFYNDQLTFLHLGNLEARFYPDLGRELVLTSPHNVNNPSEVRRLAAENVRADELSFGGLSVSSRAIGLRKHKFVLPEAEITPLRLVTPGTLLLGSHDLWGEDSSRRHSSINSKLSNLGAFALESVARQLAKDEIINSENKTSAIIARIE